MLTCDEGSCLNSSNCKILIKRKEKKEKSTDLDILSFFWFISYCPYININSNLIEQSFVSQIHFARDFGTDADMMELLYRSKLKKVFSDYLFFFFYFIGNISPKYHQN